MSKIHEALKRAAGDMGEESSKPAGPSSPGPDTESPPASAGSVRPDSGWPPLPFEKLRAYRLEADRGLVTEYEPKSLAAEQFRTLRTRILRLAQDRPRKLLLITSPALGDGKTLVSSNLAMSLARRVDAKVLLVDCDLRRPAVHRFFGLNGGEQPGLHDYLTGQVPLEKVIWRYGGSSLHVLSAGSVPDNPSELLGSQRMERTVRYLAGQFDSVVFDAPPLNPVADPAILIPLADGVLTVVRYGRTGRAGLKRALEAIPEEKFMGLVFNAAEMKFSGYYYNYDYGTE